MRYWCFVTSKDNWKVCKDKEVWGMDYRYYVTLKEYMDEGDKAVVYAHGGDFVATIEITSEVYHEDEDIGWKRKGESYNYPYRIDIEILNEGRLHISYSTKSDEGEANHFNQNHIDNIMFIADKGRTWNIYFQVSVLAIPERDYEYINKNL